MAAMARMFAREGAKLVIADVLEHEGRQVADAIGASARFEPLGRVERGTGARSGCRSLESVLSARTHSSTGGMRTRKSGSQLTRRWRKKESNPQSPV
jgi:NAD(P)-dependent dehydrogenase (short-subunit alcohol dehydrogenase family)